MFVCKQRQLGVSKFIPWYLPLLAKEGSFFDNGVQRYMQQFPERVIIKSLDHFREML